MKIHPNRRVTSHSIYKVEFEMRDHSLKVHWLYFSIDFFLTVDTSLIGAKSA